jgi:hypothetical protein
LDVLCVVVDVLVVPSVRVVDSVLEVLAELPSDSSSWSTTA